MKTKHEHCFICERSAEEVTVLISIGDDNNLLICDDCIEALQATSEQWKSENLLDFEDLEKDEFISKIKVPKPQAIKSYLDKHVIGQDYAKKVLSVAIYNHYNRLKNKNGKGVKKSNIMMAGPTGCGKTELARTIAKMLDVPFAIADATTLTEAGYVGDDTENILLQLIEAADGDVKKAETGIIFIDEIDKIARKGENVSITRDVSGEGVQQTLLKIVEGADVKVTKTGGRRHPNEACYTINTENILFIASGAFEGIVKAASGKNNKIAGFVVDDKKVNEEDVELAPEDFRKFGMIPELMGRFPVIAQLKELTKEDLVRILTEPEDSIVSSYVRTFAFDEVKLEFTDEALNEIAETAIKNKTGARGLKAIIEKSLLDTMYKVPSDNNIGKVTITPAVIQNSKAAPIIEYRKKKHA